MASKSSTYNGQIQTMIKTSRTFAAYLLITSFHLGLSINKAIAVDKNDSSFQHLSNDFKNNNCKNVTCREVTQAAGVSATFDQGVYKVYKTKRELESAEASLSNARAILEFKQREDQRNRGLDPVIKYEIRKYEVQIKELEAKVSELPKSLSKDLQNTAKVYGISNPNDIYIIDEENKSIQGSLFGNRGGFAIVMKKIENGKTTYIVSIKGTEKSSANDIITDLDSDPVKIEQGDKGKYSLVESSEVIVPKGFREYSKSIVDDKEGVSFNLIKDVVQRQNEGQKVEVIVTGHSLGGASSVIYSAMLQNRGIKPENIKTITFAAPPAANQQQFVNRYGKISSNLTRVQDYGDAVIDLPIYTSPNNAKDLPLLGGRARKVINDYQNYYVETNNVKNGKDPFLYGELLDGPKVGETLNDKVDRLKSFRSKLNGLTNEQFWGNSELVQELKELNSTIKQEGLLDIGKGPLGGPGFVIRTTLDNLNPFGNLWSTLGEILSTPFRLNELGRVSVNQIEAQYSAAIDLLRAKKLIEKGGVHVGYGNYYAYGKQFLPAERVDNLNQSSSDIAVAMLTNNSCIVQASSSHIGSASCSFSASAQPIQDDSNSVLEASRGRGQSLQESSQYTTGQIVRAPLDIGLTWNQNTKLDLDSHLVTPNSEHIYFSQRGALNQAPNAFLYRDSIPDGGLKGAEQLRITQFQQGEYRFYVYNYSDSVGSQAAQAAGLNGLSNSGATVKLYEGGQPLTSIPNDPNIFDLNNPNVQRVGAAYPGSSTFNVPTNQPGNTWYVFKLNTRTGILYRVDRLGNSPNSIGVPNVR